MSYPKTPPGKFQTGFIRRDAAQRRHHRDRLPALLGTPKLHEECGVFGIIGNETAAAPIIALGLHALQHRGQEAAGIVTLDRNRFISDRQPGLVGDHFTKPDVLQRLKGTAGIGHTRYSTTGEPVPRNIQPLYADLDRGGIAISHNGNLTNSTTVRRNLINKGSIFHTTSDTENFLQLAALSRGMTMADKLIDALSDVEGAYALCVLTQNMLIGVRDPQGIRPLVLGKSGDAHVLASETCAFDLIGATYIRDVEPGEVVIMRHDGSFESRRFAPKPRVARPCIFELIYFSRPDSFIEGESVYTLRKRLGEALATENPVDADLVAPIPDSGIAAAIGYAQKSGLPYEMALIRGHYAGRTFIQPDQKIREAGVVRKLATNRGVIDGKRVVLIDDSLVRGTTSRKLTKMLKDAGAREVHFRIACPPIMYPDYYGIDTPSRKELLAAQKSSEEIRDLIGADSLAFLSLGGLYEAAGKGPRDSDAPAFTDHCFTGDYPTPLSDIHHADHTAKIEQLSFLAETS